VLKRVWTNIKRLIEKGAEEANRKMENAEYWNPTDIDDYCDRFA